jgi:hypothetical protein
MVVSSKLVVSSELMVVSSELRWLAANWWLNSTISSNLMLNSNGFSALVRKLERDFG